MTWTSEKKTNLPLDISHICRARRTIIHMFRTINVGCRVLYGDRTTDFHSLFGQKNTLAITHLAGLQRIRGKRKDDDDDDRIWSRSRCKSRDGNREKRQIFKTQRSGTPAFLLGLFSFFYWARTSGIREKELECFGKKIEKKRRNSATNRERRRARENERPT